MHSGLYQTAIGFKVEILNAFWTKILLRQVAGNERKRIGNALCLP